MLPKFVHPADLSLHNFDNLLASIRLSFSKLKHVFIVLELSQPLLEVADCFVDFSYLFKTCLKTCFIEVNGFIFQIILELLQLQLKLLNIFFCSTCLNSLWACYLLLNSCCNVCKSLGFFQKLMNLFGFCFFLLVVFLFKSL